MSDYEAVIFDVDGTIVRGEKLVAGASAGFDAIDRAGCDRLLFSNNPTRTGSYYREKLTPYGIDIDPDRVLTAASVSATYLATTHPEETVYLVGEKRLADILEAAGIELTAEPTATDLVLGSFMTDFSFETLTAALQALEYGDSFYGTDPDTTIPVDGGRIPGSGAIIAAMEAVAGREPDAILGKPSTIAAEAAIDRLAADPEQTLVVGDRLNTDIALGNRAGMDSALVLTGITDRETLSASDIEPTYVIDSLADIDQLLE